MTSALQPLASVSSSTVLPVPKPPGMAALPPSATGNRQSMTRWPVTSGSPDGSRARTGRGTRTGQSWPMASSRWVPSARDQRADGVELTVAAGGGDRRHAALGIGRHEAGLRRPEAPRTCAKTCPAASTSPTAASGSK